MRYDFDHLFKVLIIGDYKSGKTYLLRRFIDDTFNDSTDTTVAVEFRAKIVQWPQQYGEPQRVKLQVWDTAGLESFRSIVRAYYRGVSIILIVVRANQNFEHKKSQINKYRTEIEGHANIPNRVIIVVETQQDTISDKKANPDNQFHLLTRDELSEVLQPRDLYVDVSAKTSHNFGEFNARLLEAFALLKPDVKQNNSSVVKSPESPPLLQPTSLLSRTEKNGWYEELRLVQRKFWLPFFLPSQVAVLFLKRVNHDITLNRITRLSPEQANNILDDLHKRLCKGTRITLNPDEDGSANNRFAPYELGFLGGKDYWHVATDGFGIKYSEYLKVTHHVYDMLAKLDSRRKWNFRGKRQDILAESYLNIIDAALSDCGTRKQTTQNFYANTLLDYVEGEVAKYFPEEQKQELEKEHEHEQKSAKGKVKKI